MPPARRDTNEERRRILRRMEWVFVYAPPIILVLFSAAGSAFLAWAVDISGTNFWGRWALGFAVILGLPAVVFVIRSRTDRDDE